jgi:hypothetical protein
LPCSFDYCAVEYTLPLNTVIHITHNWHKFGVLSF